MVRKPYALVLIVDVIQQQQQAEAFLKKLDEQLKDRGSQRMHRSTMVLRLPNTRFAPRLVNYLPQETCYAIVNEQLLASDDLAVLQGVIDACLGKSTDKKLHEEQVFVDARQQTSGV